ncbi:polysaccharide biosynthesis/export family protein [Rhodocytophaga aerolata]|uniref:Polysaccharide biosynthesis/export family protein n=1 Tax=Rhodocytophaga aerolata TaxID=455078 RepID=A0ABT8RG62_9BACT|nr:polysaccharide biosynthesis/export family protein [Rhodocytophaga aerolata]MDO1449785.1 polysaccharide biosynthesis/export family protein [Rhodocytophaga aerolata]
MLIRKIIQRSLLYKKIFNKAFLSLYLSYILLFLAFGCVPVGKQKYMQDRRHDTAPTINAKEYALMIPEYKLKADDIVSVEVFSLTQEKFNFLGSTPKMELTVNRQGNIELPVVGDLKVAGLTVGQMQEKIKELTADYLKSPKVTVKLVNFNFTVLGEVGDEGTFKADGGNLTILQAIGQAGGLTEFADRASVRIIRHDQATASVYKVNVLEDNILLSDRYFIQPNDVILVDPLAKKNARTTTSNLTLGLSILGTINSAFIAWLFILYR